MRLASGVAPVRSWLDAGCRVGLGVDGSASTDGRSRLAEARQTLQLQRVAYSPDALAADESLNLATRGGGTVLDRDDTRLIARHNAIAHAMVRNEAV